jgi:hypothetical protein
MTSSGIEPATESILSGDANVHSEVRITVFCNLPVVGIKKTRVRNTSKTGPVIQWLRLDLTKGTNRVGVSPWPENRNRSSFRNVIFSSYLEYRTMDRVHKPSVSECYAPSSEPFRLYLLSETISCVVLLFSGSHFPCWVCSIRWQDCRWMNRSGLGRTWHWPMRESVLKFAWWDRKSREKLGQGSRFSERDSKQELSEKKFRKLRRGRPAGMSSFPAHRHSLFPYVNLHT